MELLFRVHQCFLYPAAKICSKFFLIVSRWCKTSAWQNIENINGHSYAMNSVYDVSYACIVASIRNVDVDCTVSMKKKKQINNTNEPNYCCVWLYVHVSCLTASIRCHETSFMSWIDSEFAIRYFFHLEVCPCKISHRWKLR